MDGVRQLMREESFSFVRLGRIAARGEDHVASNRVRMRVNGRGRIRRVAIGVYTHVAEVMSESWLEKVSHGRRHGLARTRHDV